MITVMSAVLGFLGSMVPEVLALFRDKRDRQHELAIMRLQMAQQSQGLQQRMEEVYALTDAIESQSLYRTYRSHIPWVDALNASVRPVLAYAFFLLYAAVKWMGVVASASSVELAFVALWGEEDQAIFAGIISFYFGQRAFRKLRK